LKSATSKGFATKRGALPCSKLAEVVLRGYFPQTTFVL
jgi:hypothetical protein